MWHGFIVGAVVTHIMPYLSSIGIVRSTSSLVATALPVASSSGRLSFGWLGDRFDKRWMMAIGFAVIGLAGLVLALTIPQLKSTIQLADKPRARDNTF